MDAMISQTDREYLFSLIHYQKTLQQRNALLKNFQKSRTFDADSLEIYDEPLLKFGQIIFEKRKNFIQEIIPILQEYYGEEHGRRGGYLPAYKDLLHVSARQLANRCRKTRRIHFEFIYHFISKLPRRPAVREC